MVGQYYVDGVLYSTIIFIGGNVPDDCLNTGVSVAVISKSGFEMSRLRLESLVFIFTFAGMERGKRKKNIPSSFIFSCLQALTFQSVLQFGYSCNAWGSFE